MAHILGKSIYNYNTPYFDDFDDFLAGTGESDKIEGLGGNDEIWGGLGDDVLYGGDGDDTIKPADPDVDILMNWGFDKAYGDDGTDTLDFRKTSHAVELYGGSGTDLIYGGTVDDLIYGGSGSDHIFGGGGGDVIKAGTGQDTAHGGDGNDTISGEENDDDLFGDEGNDYLAGGAGDDQIYGGYGNDKILGEAGKDELWGGAGADIFFFKSLESAPSNPDYITDFEAAIDRVVGAWDKIDVNGPTGSASNYFELSIGFGDGYQSAKDFAQTYIGDDTRYVFVTDHVHGYLFSDVNGNGTMDNGILLVGLTDLSDFGYKNIVDLI